MTRSRAVGAFVGLACGDALGRPVEFLSPTAIRSKHGDVTTLLGNGTHGQPAGTVTDDTDMALCIAEKLVTTETFVPALVADRFIQWYETDPFDIGMLTATVLRQLSQGGSWDTVGIEEWAFLPEGQNAGNGSLMRCCPYALAFTDQPDSLTTVSRVSSAITHADPRCQWACVLLNFTLAGLLRGDDRPLERALDRTPTAPAELREAVLDVCAVLNGDRTRSELSLSNSGYVVTTLQAALFHGLTAETAEKAIVDAVMMGGDTDTIGAVTGAIAGARFGQQALPDRWVNGIPESNRIQTLAETLFDQEFGVDRSAREFVESGALSL